jgi:cytoskeletal protein CcmA (bactofilin family)
MAFSNNHTLIAKDTTIKGELSFSGELQIEGTVEGNVIADPAASSRLVIAESGVVTGNVYAANVLINGAMSGDVYSSARVELAKKAQMFGTLHYVELQVVNGASINGRLIKSDAETMLIAPETTNSAEKLGARENVVAIAGQ